MFEQVSGLGHQMSLSGTRVSGGLCTGARAGAEMRGFPCMARSNASWVMVIWDPPEQTDTTENITFLQIRWWVVFHEEMKHQMIW